MCGCRYDMTTIQAENREVSSAIWTSVTHAMRSQLQHAVASSPMLQAILEGEYPRLLKLTKDLWRYV